MRVAFFHELPPGGAKKAVLEYGAAFSKKGITTDLYYVNEKREKHVGFANEYYYKFTPKKWSGGNWKVRVYKDTIELSFLKKLHKKIAKEIDDKKYDFVFVHSSKYTQSPFILQFLSTYSVYYCHDPHLRIAYEKVLGIKEDLPFTRKLYERVNRLRREKVDKENILAADLLIANSRFTSDAVFQAFGRKAEVSYLGVNTDIFKKQKIKKEYDVFFIGSEDEVDGYYDLLHTLKLLPDLRVKILDFKKEWVGKEEVMTSYYNKAKIVLCLAHNEPFGLVPLEAMSCCVPVIAVNEGGYKETVLNNKTGYLTPRDPKIIAQKIAFLLKNKDLATVMGKEGRKYIEDKWTWDIAALSLLKKVRSTR